MFCINYTFLPTLLLRFLYIVKLRFRSRSGEGQVKLRKVRKVRYLDLSYTIFLVFNIDSGSLNIDSGSHTNF